MSSQYDISAFNNHGQDFFGYLNDSNQEIQLLRDFIHNISWKDMKMYFFNEQKLSQNELLYKQPSLYGNIVSGMILYFFIVSIMINLNTLEKIMSIG